MRSAVKDMGLEDRFEWAVANLAASLQGCMVEGKLEFPSISPDRDLLALELGIHIFPSSTDCPRGYCLCDEVSAAELFKRAIHEGQLAAWELCEEVTAHRLVTGDEVPEALRAFGALVIRRDVERPRAPRRNKTWARAQLYYALVRLAETRAGLNRTRNDETPPPHRSACDAVVAALAVRGFHTSYRAVKEVRVGSQPENMRLREEHAHWEAATRAALENDPVARDATSGILAYLWAFTWSRDGEAH